jgi:acyl-CoA dehydrogenase
MNPHDLQALKERTRAFVSDVVIPAEAHEPSTGVDEAMRRDLQSQARAAGVFAPHAPVSLGGGGLDLYEQSVIFEEAGYSLLGPIALNCAAPDEGNMHLLERVGTPEQQDRYLRPLVSGDVRSCFAMTEPAPGAGSDPSMLLTTARPKDGGWVLNGRKWLITGAEGAAFVICMARTGEADDAATMFLVDAANAGFTVSRHVPTPDKSMPGGHAEVVFDDCFVPADAVLGESHQGFRYAQVRLVPARLTHCMRWLGIARRSLDIALDQTAGRDAFGSPLQQLGLAQALIADSVIAIESSRAVIREACRAIVAGERGTGPSSLAKVYVSEAVFRVIDRAIQLCGGAGVTNELPLTRYLIEARAFRIYDGPSEVHRFAIARRAVRTRERLREPASDGAGE